MKRITLELPEELLERLDKAAGDVPRNRWIRTAVEHRLEALNALAALPTNARAQIKDIMIGDPNEPGAR